MNKLELTVKISERTGLPMAKVDLVLTEMAEIIMREVHRGDEVKITGFGTFLKSKRKARMARNPRTGEMMKVPAYWFPKIRFGQAFKEMVR